MQQVQFACPDNAVMVTTEDSVNFGWCVTFQHTYSCDASFSDNPISCEVIKFALFAACCLLFVVVDIVVVVVVIVVTSSCCLFLVFSYVGK